MIGGYDGNKCYNDVDVFDIDKKTWITANSKGKLPSPRNAHTVTSVEKKLYLFGGHSGNKHLKDLFIFDTTNYEWSEILYSGDSPEGLRGHTSTQIGNQILIFGGYDGKGRSNNIHILELSNNRFSLYKNKDKFPSIRQRHSAVSVDNKKIYIFGGFDGSKWLNDVHVLNYSLLLENIISEQFKIEFIKNISEIKNNKMLCDTNLLLDDGEQQTIKQILVSRSSYFNNLFTIINKDSREIDCIDKLVVAINITLTKYETNENSLLKEEAKNTEKLEKSIVLEKTYNLNEISANYIIMRKNGENKEKINTILINSCTLETINIILDYIYSGETTRINFETSKKIIVFAKAFDLALLYKFCELRIIEKINMDNIYEVLILAYEYNLINLRDYLLNRIKSNYKDFSSSLGLINLEAYPKILMDIMMISLSVS